MSLLPKSSSDKKDDYFIKKALEKVFNNCYRQWDNNEISIFIKNLINESQNTIKEAEESILDEIFIVLKMYGVKHPLFIKHRKEIDECRRKHSNRSYDRDKETNDNLFNNDKNRISKALIKAVKEDVSLKESIFEAVKKKITDNQYDESSILFEFFQNADDCVNHLAICNRKIDDQNKTFIVNIKETQIVISEIPLRRGIKKTALIVFWCSGGHAVIKALMKDHTAGSEENARKMLQKIRDEFFFAGK